MILNMGTYFSVRMCTVSDKEKDVVSIARAKAFKAGGSANNPNPMHRTLDAFLYKESLVTKSQGFF